MNRQLILGLASLAAVSVASADAEDDTGTAEILRAKRDIGLMLIVR